MECLTGFLFFMKTQQKERLKGLSLPGLDGLSTSSLLLVAAPYLFLLHVCFIQGYQFLPLAVIQNLAQVVTAIQFHAGDFLAHGIGLVDLRQQYGLVFTLEAFPDRGFFYHSCLVHQEAHMS